MYFYIGILTASLLVLTNAGNGLSIWEKRQANSNKIQEIIESGKTLTEIIKDLKGLLSDSLSSYIGDLDKEVKKIDTNFDGLKTEERRYVDDAHYLLKTSGTKLFLLRQTLTLLAKDTIQRSNRIIKVFKMVEDKPDKATMLIIYSQKKMNRLFDRSKGILKQSLDDYKDIIENVTKTTAELDSFIRCVDGLGDDDNERFKQWKKEMRVKVYGGSAACVVVAPICLILYPAAAGILESKIKKRKETVQRLINAARNAEIKAENLKKKVDKKAKYVTREIVLVSEWSDQVDQNSEEYASSEEILCFINIYGHKEAISMLCGLTKASKDYIDHKLPGLEQYEITAPELDSACSSSGTPTPGLEQYEITAPELDSACPSSGTPTPGTTCDASNWPDLDHGLTCGDCKALINKMSSKYITCDNYCKSIGQRCSGAWEESGDSCKVHSTETCAHRFIYTTDAICECGPTLSG